LARAALATSDSKSVAPARPASGAQGFAKYFQRIAWILQIFPRIALAVLLDFKGLQGKKGNKKFRRVDGVVADPIPHRPGRAEFPHPVRHEREISSRRRSRG
jgi:hypothetical protein